jgi:hypothetical protein
VPRDRIERYGMYPLANLLNPLRFWPVSCFIKKATVDSKVGTL